MLAQNRDDLFFREPATLHRPSLRQGRTLILRGGKTQWQVIENTRRYPAPVARQFDDLAQALNKSSVTKSGVAKWNPREAPELTQILSRGI